MGRKITFNLLEGTGTASVPAYGWLSIRPTREYTNGNFLVLATEDERRIQNGTVIFPDVQPTPTADPNTGKYPWAYIVHYRNAVGYEKSWNVLVPAGTGDLQGSQLVEVVQDDVHYNIMQGPKGDRGDGLRVLGAYQTVEAMKADNPLPKRGDSFLVGSKVWVYDGAAWGASGDLTGAKGDKGNTGNTGTTGATGQKGATGATGVTPAINVIANTGEPGTAASVVKTGTNEAPVLTFTIPRGAQGAQGNPGTAGAKGDKGATGAPGAGIQDPGSEYGQILTSDGAGNTFWGSSVALPWIATSDAMVEGDANTLAEAKAYTESYSSVRQKNLLSALKSPMVIAHRGGGALVYPEQSFAGVNYTIEQGFYPEVDVCALSDGTLVNHHDNSISRLLVNGVTGNTTLIENVTPALWRSARVPGAMPGAKTAKTTYFLDFLNQFGGKTILVPEVKASPMSVTQDVVAAIKARGLQKSIILQFGGSLYTNAKYAASEGITVAIGINTGSAAEMPDTFANIKAAGIDYLIVNRTAANSVITNGTAAGLRSLVWTISDPKDQEAQFARGAFGVFSDDPDYTSRQVPLRGSSNFSEGIRWPGMRPLWWDAANSPTDYTAWNINNLSLGDNSVGYFQNPVVGGIKMVELSHMFQATNPLRIRFTVYFGTEAGGQSSGAGLALIQNTAAADKPYYDRAEPGQNGWTAVVRRNGTINLYKYTNGAAATLVATSSGAEFAPAGKGGRAEVEIVVSASGCSVRSITNGGDSGYVASPNNFANMKFWLRWADLSAEISDVRVFRA